MTLDASVIGTFVHPFDPAPLRRFTWRQKLTRRLLAHPEWLFHVLRAIRPNVWLGGPLFVLRYDDVQEVLTRHNVFAVPFGPRIMEVDLTGQNFILGVDDGDPAYRIGLAHVMRAMRREDLDRIGGLARCYAEEVLSTAGNSIDVVADLFTPVATHIVDAYFGVAADRPSLALWAMALSNWIFATLGENDTAKRAALGAGERLGRTVDSAIASAMLHAGHLLSPDEATLADRLARDALAAAPGQPLAAIQDAIRPALDGLITAFVPNCTVAATNILNVLLDRPEIMAQCRAAAGSADDASLGRHLLEAFRFRPLFPGPPRRCARAFTVAADSGHAVRVKPGRIVIACTQSAMFDGRRVTRPRTFNPDRAASHFMQFGFGLHTCVGAALATAQLVNTFRPLLCGPPVARAHGSDGRVTHFGAFPEHMVIRFSG